MLALFVALLPGCPRKDERPDPPAVPSPQASPAPKAGPRAEEEACVDAFLQQKKLDRYGSPEGTMYAGGNPLFDERTGQTQDRLAYVYARAPEAAAACQRDR